MGTDLRWGSPIVATFWWVGHANFGDDLTRWLLPRYGVLPLHRPSSQADLMAVGSILGLCDSSYEGTVWGSGLLVDEQHPLPRARILALRGRLTQERVGSPDDVVLGDPGLLVSLHTRRRERRWDVGFVPHAGHQSSEAFVSVAKRGRSVTRIIDVRQSAPRAAADISACGTIVTTSLHGLITADSFGIPAVWTRLTPDLHGGDFKFRDYESVVTPGLSRFVEFDSKMTPEDLVSLAQAVPRERVLPICTRLEEAIGRWSGELEGGPRFPTGIVSALTATRTSVGGTS